MFSSPFMGLLILSGPILDYLIFGSVLAVYGYTRKAENYNFYSAIILVFLWPIVLLIFLIRLGRAAFKPPGNR